MLEVETVRVLRRKRIDFELTMIELWRGRLQHLYILRNGISSQPTSLRLRRIVHCHLNEFCRTIDQHATSVKLLMHTIRIFKLSLNFI